MSLLEKLEEAVCVYKSTRFIRVRNRKLVSIYYLTMVLILIYICVYTIWIENGYQAIDQVTGTTSSKLKGTGAVNKSQPPFEVTVYDAMDLVVPSIEEDAFFITTQMIITRNQTRDYCPGYNAHKPPNDVPLCDYRNYSKVCIENEFNPQSQGILTGRCCTTNETAANLNPSKLKCNSTLPNVTYNPTDVCEVMTWCPTEIDNKYEGDQVMNIGNFTAFVKVDIAFSAFDVSRTNVLNVNGDYTPKDGYNLFTLNEIIGNATDGAIRNVSQDIIINGAIILMESEWNCNLDKGESECNPNWKFFRIDSEPGTMSKGFNYRAVDYDVSMKRRLLRKLYGIRVVFTTSGTGRKFSFAALTVTFGAGLAYLGAAAFVADIVLEKFLPQSDAYVRLKNKDGEDAIALSQRRINAADDDYHDLSLSTNEQFGTHHKNKQNGQLIDTKDE